MKNLLTGIVGAVFATGSGFGDSGGGAELTLLSMLTNVAELGLIIVPLPKNTPGYPQGGMQWGPVGRSADLNLNPTGLSDDSLVAARHHGANVARVADVIKEKNLFAKGWRPKISAPVLHPSSQGHYTSGGPPAACRRVGGHISILRPDRFLIDFGAPTGVIDR